jgi:hypothetical protein
MGCVFYSLYTFAENTLENIRLDETQTIHLSMEPLGDDQIRFYVEGEDEPFDIPLTEYQSDLYRKIRSGDKDYEMNSFGSLGIGNYSIKDTNNDGIDELVFSNYIEAEYTNIIAFIDVSYQYDGFFFIKQEFIMSKDIH